MSSTGSSSVISSQIADQYLDLKGEVVEAAFKIATLLHCDVNKQVIALALMLIEKGVNPESVADVIAELKNMTNH